MKRLLFFLFICSLPLFSESIKLYNDSAYTLRCVLRAADGSYLSEMVVLPQRFNVWTESYNTYGGQQSPYSQTPYTVIWYCLDGNDFSICTNVSTGAMVTALGCDGTKVCKPPQAPKQQQYPPPSSGEELHDENALKKQYEQQQQSQGVSP